MTHRFRPGQIVRLSKGQRYSNVAGGLYEVKRQLPTADGDLNYLIRSADEQFDRVVKEGDLVAGVTEGLLLKTEANAFRSGGNRGGMRFMPGDSRAAQRQQEAGTTTLAERRLRQKLEGAEAMAEHVARNQKVDERTLELRAKRLARDEQATQDQATSQEPRRKSKKVVRRPFLQNASR